MKFYVKFLVMRELGLLYVVIMGPAWRSLCLLSKTVKLLLPFSVLNYILDCLLTSTRIRNELQYSGLHFA